MKKFLIFLGIFLMSCGPSHQEYPSSNKDYISKVIGKTYHNRSCPGHEIIVEKHVFEEEGHDMWLWLVYLHGITGYESITVEHSPNCKKCHSENTSIFDDTFNTSSDWGW